MARIPEYPPILNGSTETQIAQIREFLMRLVRDLADAGVYEEQSGGGEGGTDDYDELLHKPKINGTELIGNKTGSQLGLASPSDIPDALSEFTDDLGNSPVHTHSQYLTEHQSLSGYATESWVDQQGYLTEHQSLDGYATEEWVEDQGYLTEHQSLAGYVQTTDARLSDARTPLPHNHDDRYYTEAEIDSRLSDKVEEPDADGTAGQVLATDGDGGRYWKTVEGGGGGTSDYTDLENKPKINNVELVGDKTLAQIGAAEAGDIPDSLSELTDDLGSNPVHTHSQYLTEHQSLSAYRTAAAQDAIDAGKQNTISDLASIRSGAALGATAVQPETGKGLFSGNYNDLTNKPTIPPAITVDSAMSSTSTNPVQNKVVKQYVDSAISGININIGKATVNVPPIAPGNYSVISIPIVAGSFAISGFTQGFIHGGSMYTIAEAYIPSNYSNYAYVLLANNSGQTTSETKTLTVYYLYK